MNLKKAYCSLMILLGTIICHAQDTIQLGTPVNYTSEVAGSRSFSSTCLYATEVIKFDNRNFNFNYYYLVDSIKKSRTQQYKLVDTSGMEITEYRNSQHWKVDRINLLKTRLSTCDKHYCVSGYAEQVIPIQFNSKVYTTSLDYKDTLWYAEYDYNDNHPWGQPTYELHNSVISGKVYSSNKCDSPPLLSSGKEIGRVEWKLTGGCYNDPYYDVFKVKCIVTDEGRIKNIRQVFGNLDLSCYSVMLSLLKRIYDLGPLKPAIKKGKPVNCEIEISIKTVRK